MITFPRPMPLAAYNFEEWIDVRTESRSITGASATNVAELAPMRRMARWKGTCKNPFERAAFEAWAESLKGGLLTFQGSPIAGKLPVAHRLGWGGLTFGGQPFTGIGTLAATADRSNLLLRSSELNNGSWFKSSGISITANATLAPDGSATADMVTAAGTSNRGVAQSFNSTPGAVYTASFWVRLGSIALSDFQMAWYDNIAADFIGAPIPVPSSVTADGWLRVSTSVIAPAGCTSLRFYPFNSVNATAGTAYLWGHQVEQGASASAYIPTTSAIVTVSPAADEITIASLPDGLTLSEGDFLSFPVASRQRLFRVTEGGISSGGQVNVGIEPARPPNASNGAPVRLQTPWCDMVLVSPPSRIVTNYEMMEFSFEGMQVLV